MIVNLEKFIARERPGWERLDRILRRLAADPARTLALDEVRELERLYQRASADLARLATFAAEPEARHYLENLVGRGYAEIHGAQAERRRLRPWEWLARTLPQTFRRRAAAWRLAVALLLAGAAFGGMAVALDPAAKPVLMPFSHLLGDPAQRVAEEERPTAAGRMDGRKATFAGQLMTHNIQVAFMALALGFTWGVGTLIFMFYNGVILGAVAVDYIMAGQTQFLLGWLLPHGVIEIPAILVGAQAGLVLAGALLGRDGREPLAGRMRAAAPDIVTLALGAALMLVWAGTIESFFSQYHAPVIPYAAKIAFGAAEGTALTWYFILCGRKPRGAGKAGT